MAPQINTIGLPSSMPADSAPAPRSTEQGIFRREGEYWTIGYAGKVFRLKHTKGFSYIAHLLRQPGTEFHVLDLDEGTAGSGVRQDSAKRPGLSAAMSRDLEAAGIHVSGLGDAGEMLDDQAKAAYRTRLAELREELEEAKALGHVERAGKAEEEIDALTAELSRAVGLGGRNRRAASATERARQRAKKTIKTAIEKITKNHAKLGEILLRCIKTGIYCSYIPDLGFAIEWQFGPSSFPLGISGPPEGISGAASDRTATTDEFRQAVELMGPLPPPVGGTPFSGRESESEGLRELMESARIGHGSLVMMAGAAGVGKTRLALEAATYASRRGCGFLLGRCYEREEPRPYLPFEEIIEMALREAPSMQEFRSAIADNATELAQIAPRLREVFPDIPPRLELPPQETRRYLFHSVTEFFINLARRKPLFLVLDDLHWSDESTLAFLMHLANRVSRIPLVAIGIYNDSELHNRPILVRTLEELHHVGVKQVKLQSLSEDDVAGMLRGLIGREPPQQLVRVIFDETQGNPFFVEELYKHLLEEGRVFDASGQFRPDVSVDETEVPDDVRLFVGRRLDRLGEAVTPILTAAAVIGRSFSFNLLETILDHFELDDLLAAIEKAQRGGLIVSSSEGPEAPFRFAHELVRQTILARASLPRRQRLHLRVAYAIEKVYARAVHEHAAEIAHHLLKAGSAAEAQKIVHYLSLAGKAALEAAAYQAALSHFTSALSYVDKTDSRQRAELLHNSAIAERGLGRWDKAEEQWDESLDLYTALGDREAIGRSCFRIAQGLLWAGRYEEAEAIAQRGLIQLETTVSTDRARLLSVRGISKAVRGDYAAAEEALSGALAFAEHLADESLQASILAFKSQFDFFFLYLREVLEDGEKIAQLSHRGNGLWAHTRQLCWAQCALYHLGRVEQATKVGEELEPLATKIGHVAALSFCTRINAWTEFGKLPDLHQLTNRLQQDLDANRAAGLEVFVSLSHAQLSVAKFLGGDWDEGLEHAQEAHRLQAPHVMQGVSIGTLFRQKAYAGDREGALALLAQQREKLPHSQGHNTFGSWAMLVLAVEGLSVLGEREQAAELYPLLCELLGTGIVCIAWVSRFPQTMAGVAATAAREWEAAEEHFRLALRQAEEFPHILEQAEIRRFYGTMLVERGMANDHEKARELLSTARNSYERIGMPRHSSIVTTLLDTLNRS